MKRILVPTDFTESAETALYYAIEMAKKVNAEIILFHAYTVFDDASSSLENLRRKEKNKIERRLESLTVKIEHSGGINYKVCSAEGPVVKSILNAVKEFKADCIIMGTLGENSLANLVFGSVTAKIIDKAKCPVISVPESASCSTIKRIVYATDYNSSDITTLNKVVEIARPYNAQINILHIAYEKESANEEMNLMRKFMEEVNEQLDYNNFSFQMLAAANIEEKMKEYIQSESADLFAMSAHHKDLWDKLADNSLTNKMAYKSSVPLLVFHHNNRSAVKLFTA